MSTSWDPLDDLSSEQRERLVDYEQLLARSNRRVNLVSRSSISEFRLVHTIHSLALAFRAFPSGATVVDWGSGGGLPGIPLAIRFPNVQFVLVDSNGKKTDVAAAICRKLGLSNVTVEQIRAEEWQGACDYSVSRATAPLAALWEWTSRVLRRKSELGDVGENVWRPGLVALKGGDLNEEIDDLRNGEPGVQVDVTPLADFLGNAFRDKYVVETRTHS